MNINEAKFNLIIETLIGFIALLIKSVVTIIMKTIFLFLVLIIMSLFITQHTITLIMFWGIIWFVVKQILEIVEFFYHFKQDLDEINSFYLGDPQQPQIE